LKQLLDSGVPIQHITFTSDSCGSLPGFDPVTGKLIKIEMGLPSSILRELKEAVLNEKVPFEQALQVATSNPADILQLAGKGHVKVGYDADLVLLDSDFTIVRVMANGRLVL
jgi:beta-aspartyl-dipeptidase (metallo-type)